MEKLKVINLAKSYDMLAASYYVESDKRSGANGSA